MLVLVTSVACWSKSIDAIKTSTFLSTPLRSSLLHTSRTQRCFSCGSSKLRFTLRRANPSLTARLGIPSTEDVGRSENGYGEEKGKECGSGLEYRCECMRKDAEEPGRGGGGVYHPSWDQELKALRRAGHLNYQHHLIRLYSPSLSSTPPSSYSFHRLLLLPLVISGLPGPRVPKPYTTATQDEDFGTKGSMSHRESAGIDDKVDHFTS
ncbi:hypothetical protein D9758_014755 [Tetrapyrgos nigripes]|uniref:Uncharacterized protein n=1 Tax=Tetrapyrgos nigripes TaxID=182062 RepID=A0A8H5FLS2_9AGAR|nr:hypothetical protein D9758_014755 [Tetrapyrgos nigripes]